MKSAAFIATLFLGLTAVTAQTINVNCMFMFFGLDYGCQIISTTIADNPEANIVIGGSHIAGRNNADVIRVDFRTSEVPFVVTQIFTTFPNIVQFSIDQAGLMRIQQNAFTRANVNTMMRLFIINNPIRSIEANAFSPLTGLVDLNLNGNQLDSVNANAFAGLSQLQSINFASNQLTTLPGNLLAPLTNIRVAVFTNNQLNSLDGQFFSTNTLLNVVEIGQNRINALGQNFLIGLNQLRSLDMRDNVCVSQFWALGGPVTIDSIRNDLSRCFNNVADTTTAQSTTVTSTTPQPGPDDLRRFVIEVRGPFTLRFENGTNIVTV